MPEEQNNDEDTHETYASNVNEIENQVNEPQTVKPNEKIPFRVKIQNSVGKEETSPDQFNQPSLL